MRSLPKRRRDEILYALLALGAGGFLCIWGGLAPVVAQEAPPAAATPAADAAAAPGVVAAGGEAPAPLSKNVRIVFTTVPSSAKAMVFWGKKRLGPIEPRRPLIVQRPRDSGPLDLMVRAEGFLPVQTRVYTFADSKIAVKLTPPDQKKTLLGYREPPPPDAGGLPPAGGGSDGGVSDAGQLPSPPP